MNKKLALFAALPALALGLAACSGAADASAPSASPKPTATAAAGFELNTIGADERIARAGLKVLPAEGTAEHYHAHLDVFFNGKPVTVPADIGVAEGPDGKPTGISPLHTHDTSGIVHVEAATAGQAYTLGQLLTEWGILDGQDATTAGTSRGTLDGWGAYVDGAKYGGPLADLRINAHDEIVLYFGSAPEKVPDSFAFPAGA
ncbi:hypothetical protein [Sinomonas atrocyanea]